MDHWNREPVSREEFLRLRQEAAARLQKMAQSQKTLSAASRTAQNPPENVPKEKEESFPVKAVETLPAEESAVLPRSLQKTAEETPAPQDPPAEAPLLTLLLQQIERAQQDTLPPQPEPVGEAKAQREETPFLPPQEPLTEEIPLPAQPSPPARETSFLRKEPLPPKEEPLPQERLYHPDADRIPRLHDSRYHPDAAAAARGGYVPPIPPLRKSLRRLFGEESKKK